MATRAATLCPPGLTTAAAAPRHITEATANYPSSIRCNAILGTAAACLTGHSGLDTIGVQLTYSDTWRTPLHDLIGLLGNGWTLVQSNQMRMEPVL